MIAATDEGLIGLRDRALILLGYAGAFRRSELVSLAVADLSFTRDGLTIALRRSKTDQMGAGRTIGVPYGSNPDTCPVRTLQAWIEEASITSGLLFRSVSRHGEVQPSGLSPIDVARVVKKLAERAGLDPKKYAGHSLRSGHATSAAIGGASERSIMKQTGHRRYRCFGVTSAMEICFARTVAAGWVYSLIGYSRKQTPPQRGRRSETEPRR
jgi:site-specific recombinase XerD